MWRSVLLIGILGLLSPAVANPWTVQVVATANGSAAQQLSDDLRQQGLPAYVATRDGLHRVRLGCFGVRADAEAVARQAKAWGVESSIVLQVGQAIADDALCVESHVGFVKPNDWRFIEGEPLPVFEVRLASTAASLSYHPDRGWLVHQVGEPIAATAVAAPEGTFASAQGTASPYVAFDNGVTQTLVCPGVLITSFGNAAIVENDHSIRACRLAAHEAFEP